MRARKKLWCHVRSVALGLFGARWRVGNHLCRHAEVPDFQPACLGDEDVVRFDVQMHNVMRMENGKSVRDLVENIPQESLWHFFPIGQEIFEGATFTQLEQQIEEAWETMALDPSHVGIIARFWRTVLLPRLVIPHDMLKICLGRLESEQDLDLFQ
jgi:hypothetical protein